MHVQFRYSIIHFIFQKRSRVYVTETYLQNVRYYENIGIIQINIDYIPPLVI